MISYNHQVRKLFEDIDRSRVRVWALTNAYRVVSFSVSNAIINSSIVIIQHAERVLRILKLTDLIDGLVFCDYSLKDFSCKPEPEFYRVVCCSQN
jgi:pyrimidine and pyridine-specific 5'-nucleotidase